MHPYFQNMTAFGKALSEKQSAKAADSVAQIQEVEQDLAARVEKVR